MRESRFEVCARLSRPHPDPIHDGEGDFIDSRMVPTSNSHLAADNRALLLCLDRLPDGLFVAEPHEWWIAINNPVNRPERQQDCTRGEADRETGIDIAGANRDPNPGADKNGGGGGDSEDFRTVAHDDARADEPNSGDDLRRYARWRIVECDAADDGGHRDDGRAERDKDASS